MENIDERYKLFRLREEVRAHLPRLSDSQFPFRQAPKRVAVDLFILDNGGRELIRKEEYDA